jgi:FKBP-type peptidyl-prolyl cis-trans isomerase 2
MIANVGNKVKIDYVLEVDGKVYDTSFLDVAKNSGIFNVDRHYGPLVFEVGSPSIIKGLNEGLEGMYVHEEKEIVVSPINGYGFRDESRIQTLPRKLIEKEEVDLTPGTKLRITTQNGVSVAVVTELTEDEVTFDLNPDLCDKTLKFKVFLRDILQ